MDRKCCRHDNGFEMKYNTIWDDWDTITWLIGLCCTSNWYGSCVQLHFHDMTRANVQKTILGTVYPEIMKNRPVRCTVFRIQTQYSLSRPAEIHWFAWEKTKSGNTLLNDHRRKNHDRYIMANDIFHVRICSVGIFGQWTASCRKKYICVELVGNIHLLDVLQQMKWYLTILSAISFGFAQLAIKLRSIWKRTMPTWWSQ